MHRAPDPDRDTGAAWTLLLVTVFAVFAAFTALRWYARYANGGTP